VWGSTIICPWTNTVSASLCTVDLTRLIEGHGLHPHLYAEKTQIYGFCRPMETQSVVERMGMCISDVAGWMSSNHLQLNTAKTEAL